MSDLPAKNPTTAPGALKPQMQLVPPTAALECAVRMMDGARKYGAYNWRETGVSTTVYAGAALRHIQSMMDGEWTDPECPFGSSHAAGLMACGAILIDAHHIGQLNDDRPIPGPTAELIRSFKETGRLPESS